MPTISKSLFVALVVFAACTADDDEDMAADTSAGTDAAPSTDATDPGDPDDTTGAPARSGEELFAAICSPCHGSMAEGTSIAYELRHVDRGYAHWVVRNGRSGGELDPSAMPAFAEATLADADIDAIVDYLDAFPQPTTGEGLYLDYCRNCHGVDALGGVVGVNLLAELAEADEIFEQVREGELEDGYGARLEFMPAFSPARLSDAEIQAIVDYLLTLSL